MARGFGAKEGRFAKSYGLAQDLKEYGESIEASESYVKYLEKEAGKSIVDTLTNGLSDEMTKAIKSDIVNVIGMTMKDGRADIEAAREKAKALFEGKTVRVSEDGKHDGQPDETIDKIAAAFKEIADKNKVGAGISDELALDINTAILTQLDDYVAEAYRDEIVEDVGEGESYTWNINEGKDAWKLDITDDPFTGVVVVDGKLYEVEAPVKNITGTIGVEVPRDDYEKEDVSKKVDLYGEVDISRATIRYVGPGVLEEKPRKELYGLKRSEIEVVRNNVEKATKVMPETMYRTKDTKMNMDDVEKIKSAVIDGVKTIKDRQSGSDAPANSSAGKAFRHAAVLTAIETMRALNNAEFEIQKLQSELAEKVKKLGIK